MSFREPAALILTTAIATMAMARPTSAVDTQVLADISVQAAADMIHQRLGHSDFVLLDIRTPAEFASARIDGAVNFNYYAPEFADRLSRLDHAKTYLIYCRVGNRTGRTMPLLERLGFEHVYNMQGGIAAWYRAGFTIVTTPPGSSATGTGGA